MKKPTAQEHYHHAALILDTGEQITIKCPEASQDELLDSLENALKMGSWWIASLIDGCTADYLGMPMDRVNMRRVVGMA